MNKKVSIIVPIYNAERYLGYTISSIIRQTYENIEVLLINDGSTDESLKICRNYEELDHRIKVIDLPNGGVSAARNRGIAEASGDYIQFADADDVLHCEMTRKLVELSEVYEKDLAVCGFKMIHLDPDLKKTGETSFACECLGKECVLTREMFFQNMSYILWKSCLLESPCNKLYRRDFIERKQIRFPVTISLGEDFCFNMDYFRLINGAAFTGEQLYYYLKTTQDTLTGCYREDFFENQLFLVQRFEKLLKEHIEMRDTEICQLSEYMTSKMIQSIENLFRKECSLQTAEKKKKIEEIINMDYIRKAFELAEYINPKYEWMREKMRYSDVQGIYAWMEENIKSENKQETYLESKGQRGLLNHFLAGCCNAILKVHADIRIEVVRDSLCERGIRGTIDRIAGVFDCR